MGDYSSVAPPQSQQNFSQSSAFAAALQRAKQIAAKIHPGSQQTTGTKRPMEDDSGPDAKKFSSPDSTSSGGGVPPANMSQAMAQAAAVAARIAATAGNTVEEQIRYPDNMIGMMMARGVNDKVSQIQAETGCKVQMSNESDRMCILRGSREAVTKAREMVQQMANQSGGGSVDVLSTVTIPPPGANGYPPYQEIMVPGPKVGLVIGKGGETIKMLQEKTGAKMVIIQDGPNQELIKPLRISGDPQKVEHAKSLVFELIQDKEQFRGGGASGGEQAEVFVPKIAVGVVIGKGGDMIKKIQGETGCKLQFIQGKNDGPGDRRCIIQGTRQQVDEAKRMIEELIDSRNNPGQRQQNQQGGGPMDNGNSAYGYGYGVNHTQQPQREEVTFAVPASKCGIVIGRGGETIKLINQQSGAYCEMDRSAVNPPSEKMFKAKGTPEQIEHARQMISEKINVDITILTRKPIGNAPNHGGPGGGQGGYGNMQNDPSAQQYQQQWGYAQGWDQSQQQQSVQMNSSAGQPDYSQQWIEYYKSMGMHREAEMIEQQLKAKQAGQPGAMPGAATNGASAPHAQQMAGAHMQQAQGGQSQDYSAQWAEYYRSIGKNEEAEAIEKQIQAQKAATGSNPQGQPQSAAAPQPPQPGYPQPTMQPAAAYAQYSQYYAAAAAAGQGGYPQAYGAYGAYPGAAPQQAPQPPQPAPGGPGGNQQQSQQQQNDKNW
ncbi:unnamed protein product [Hermetia illucens]|uniref:K Homology domain-containing protein n=1 Tax=Hermetia illucens TaxID=343691 RepID=A0A7R8UWU2_HERIL|nr:far upstream element-binding protein 1 isoform X5 [Hermetia illucens]CAD7088041.1 unnamed protein product [Hermetia illucens]